MRRRIVESLQDGNLSFSELLNVVGESNHGGFGFHLRALKEFIELDLSTRKYHLTRRGKLLASAIWDLRSVSLRGKIPSEYVEKLTSRDHAFVLFDDESFKRGILKPYLRAGLLKGQAVVYLVSEQRVDSETREIQEDGIDLNALTVMSSYEWYLEKGKARARTIVANWLKLLKEKRKAGFAGLHVAGEMDIFFDHGRTGEMLKYEETLGRRLPAGLCGLCFYDPAKLGKSHFPRLFACHGHLISKDVVGKI